MHGVIGVVPLGTTQVESEATQFLKCMTQLGVDVAPFAHAHEGEEVLPAEFAQL